MAGRGSVRYGVAGEAWQGWLGLGEAGEEKESHMSVELVKQILMDLHEEGDLTPEHVVEVARAPEHPLHSRFEWDDSLAAEVHRRSQAAALIRSVRVVYKEDFDGIEKTTRAFVSVRPPDAARPRYEPVEQVLADPLTRQMLLRDARREWMAFKRKYEALREFASIIAGTDSEAG